MFYLQLTVQDLVPRVLAAGKMNYWESGMDMNYGDDLYDSFVAYQSELIEQFNTMAEEYKFPHASTAGRSRRPFRGNFAKWSAITCTRPATRSRRIGGDQLSLSAEAGGR